jgi:hypothetical protein
MSKPFFDKLNAAQLCKDNYLDKVIATLKQQTCENERANGEERKANFELFKDMTDSFMADFKIGLRKEISPLREANASLEVQLELMKELRIYQAQAIELNVELGAFQDFAVKNTTKVADLVMRGLTTTALQDPSIMVSTESVQRTIRELVCNLTSEIFRGTTIGVQYYTPITFRSCLVHYCKTLQRPRTT